MEDRVAARAVLFLPLIVVACFVFVLFWALRDGRDPALVPSVMVGKSVPEFNAPAIAGSDIPALSRADFTAGESAQDSEGLQVLNFFASWCVPCRAEHSQLIRLKDSYNFALYGVNYKDAPAAARAWLEELGNPYRAIGVDADGLLGIELGITGVPETFIIGGGVILYHHRGPIVGASALGDFTAALKRAGAR